MNGRRWLYGPLPDLLFGCGLLYAAFFLAQTLAGARMREVFPLEYQAFLTLALGAPHYGATLLRVYEQREERRRYAFFALWATLALAAAFVVGLHVAAVGSALLTVYFTWSPWHYTGQNYGVAVMFLRRRGVEVTPATGRLLRASFVLSFLLVLIVFHGRISGESYAPGSYDGTGYRFVAVGIPFAFEIFVVLCAAYTAAVVAAIAQLARRAPLADLAPTLALVALQALWFGVPVMARQWGVGDGVDPLRAGSHAYTFMWVAMGHFVQYLWITSYYAGASHARSQARYLTKALLAGVAVWVGPALLFAPSLLGGPPHELGLGILAASVVNIHHFVLDGAIWKLRDGRIARVLLRSEPEAPPTDPAGPRSPVWLRRGAWLAGGALVVLAFAAQNEQLALRRAEAQGDAARAARAVERLGWMGRSGPTPHLALAAILARQGDHERARHEVERSLAAHPTLNGWQSLAALRELEGDWAGALEARRGALDLEPEHVPSLVGAARALAWLERPAEARALLERARRLRPDAEGLAALLRRLEHAESGAGAD